MTVQRGSEGETLQVKSGGKRGVSIHCAALVLNLRSFALHRLTLVVPRPPLLHPFLPREEMFPTYAADTVGMKRDLLASSAVRGILREEPVRC